jgi:hypothetical protein
LFENFDHGKPYYPSGTGIKIPDQHGVRAVDIRMVRAAG